MSETVGDAASPSLWRRLGSKRRRWVFEKGKKLRKPLRRFLARQSRVGDPAIFDADTFAWARDLETAAPQIRHELDQLLERRDRLPPFQMISEYNARIASEDHWRVFVLFGFGERSERYCALCPETTRALEAIAGLKTAWFSILAPHYHVPRHKGITKGLVRAHLGLKVPQDRERCRMVVGDQEFHWEEGRCVVFDDSRRHEVFNDTDEERVVLLLDVERPMKFGGRCASRFFLWMMRHTNYVRDARRRQRAWEDRFHAGADERVAAN
ncbi:MAG: aspartyl/asparaginyl beta-hydroxylase domain-containing protein [Salinibacterium sp.]|nr:aspartyl/asparaginyl beta-hydroxylase domain-containing protein [Salinibacterium sp.]